MISKEGLAGTPHPKPNLISPTETEVFESGESKSKPDKSKPQKRSNSQLKTEEKKIEKSQNTIEKTKVNLKEQSNDEAIKKIKQSMKRSKNRKVLEHSQTRKRITEETIIRFNTPKKYCSIDNAGKPRHNFVLSLQIGNKDESTPNNELTKMELPVLEGFGKVQIELKIRKIVDVKTPPQKSSDQQSIQQISTQQEQSSLDSETAQKTPRSRIIYIPRAIFTDDSKQSTETNKQNITMPTDTKNNQKIKKLEKYRLFIPENVRRKIQKIKQTSELISSQRGIVDDKKKLNKISVDKNYPEEKKVSQKNTFDNAISENLTSKQTKEILKSDEEGLKNQGKIEEKTKDNFYQKRQETRLFPMFSSLVEQQIETKTGAPHADIQAHSQRSILLPRNNEISNKINNRVFEQPQPADLPAIIKEEDPIKYPSNQQVSFGSISNQNQNVSIQHFPQPESQYQNEYLYQNCSQYSQSTAQYNQSLPFLFPIQNQNPNDFSTFIPPEQQCMPVTAPQIPLQNQIPYTQPFQQVRQSSQSSQSNSTNNSRTGAQDLDLFNQPTIEEDPPQNIQNKNKQSSHQSERFIIKITEPDCTAIQTSPRHDENTEKEKIQQTFMNWKYKREAEVPRIRFESKSLIKEDKVRATQSRHIFNSLFNTYKKQPPFSSSQDIQKDNSISDLSIVGSPSSSDQRIRKVPPSKSQDPEYIFTDRSRGLRGRINDDAEDSEQEKYQLLQTLRTINTQFRNFINYYEETEPKIEDNKFYNLQSKDMMKIQDYSNIKELTQMYSTLSVECDSSKHTQPDPSITNHMCGTSKFISLFPSTHPNPALLFLKPAAEPQNLFIPPAQEDYLTRKRREDEEDKEKRKQQKRIIRIS